jgi:uncharacterized membrane protein YeaQ/YmgE (transglycosylase-associated protein family)
MSILAWIVFGLIIGLIARALVPGKQSMGLVMTTLLGIAGAVIGGFIAQMITGTRADGFQPAGFIGALLGAIALLLIVGAVMGRRRVTA